MHSQANLANDRLCRLLIFTLMAVLLLLFITSCAIVSYNAAPDGTTKVNLYSLGSDKIMEDFKASISKTGERNLSIGSFDANQTEGLRQVNEGMKMIVEGAAKGTVSGLKP